MKRKFLALFLLAATIFTAPKISAADSYSWKSNSTGWWLENSSGSYKTSTWSKVDGVWYYSKSSGYIAQSQWLQVGSKWYYFTGSGAMVSNVWQGNYYLGSNGDMLTNTITNDGYRVDKSGKWDSSVSKMTSYKVTHVSDGDTITVNYNGTNEKVRLIGIDTPESVHPDASRNVPEGKIASQFTKSQLLDKNVYLEFDIQQRDKYGRLLAYVYIDGHMFNKTLLEKGYAKIATFPPNVKYVDEFRAITSDGSAYNPNNNNQNNKNNTGKLIKGNIKTKIYHLPGQQSYDKISEENTVYFATEAEAIAAGYRKAKR